MGYRRGEGIALLIGVGIGFGFLIVVVSALTHIAFTMASRFGT